MTKKLIITDLDGCLNPEESIPWDLDSFHEFAHLCRQAADGDGPIPRLTLCTGRPQPYVEALMKILDIRLPAICEGGAVMYSLHDNRAYYGPGVTEEKIIGLRNVRAFIETHILPKYPGLLIQFGKEANLSVFTQQPDVFEEIVPVIERYNYDTGGPKLTIYPSHYYLNISIAGVDKGSALRQLFEHVGVAPEEAVGIGDTEGDLPIRENTAYFACPANARQAIKNVADYVSPYPDIKGLLDILKQPVFSQ